MLILKIKSLVTSMYNVYAGICKLKLFLNTVCLHLPSVLMFKIQLLRFDIYFFFLNFSGYKLFEIDLYRRIYDTDKPISNGDHYSKKTKENK